jgi:hypothetical protein
MTWLTDTHDVTGWYALAVVFLVSGSVAVVMGQFQDHANQRWRQARSDACRSSARARAAEHPYRTRLHAGHRVIEEAVPLITMAAPTAEFLDAWDAEVQGLPWGWMMNQALADVVHDPRSCTPKLPPRRRPSTAELERMVSAA